jgi:hypothetical protein
MEEGQRYIDSLGLERFWRWRFCGLWLEREGSDRRIAISHWLVIAPMTLLAAYLLLWNPKPKEPPHA